MDRNKSVVHAIASEVSHLVTGTLRFARWSSEEWRILVRVGAGPEVSSRPGVFEYGEPKGSDLTEWHVNFADPDLFRYYPTGLFAQDEIQVAEHPALGALRDRLVREGQEPLTEHLGVATPCTVMGVPRQCSVSLGAGPGRPLGLYGNAFSGAARDAITDATSAVDPPTISNIVAIAAPSHGSGPYTFEDVEFILGALTTGYSAAAAQSERSIVHTGFWGCGAFGGNRVLLPALQIVAAAWSGVSGVVFYTFDAVGQLDFDDAFEVSRDLLSRFDHDQRIDDVIDAAVSLRLEWGTGDGN